MKIIRGTDGEVDWAKTLHSGPVSNVKIVFHKSNGKKIVKKLKARA